MLTKLERTVINEVIYIYTQGIFVVIFCASLRRACPLYQRACPLCQRVHPLHHKGGSVSVGDDAMDNTLLHLLSASGVLMVLGAFILVIMVGVPSWLKAVYVGVFFISLLIYQVRECERDEWLGGDGVLRVTGVRVRDGG